MYSKFKKSVPFNYCKGHVLCIQFSLPSWSLFQLSHALGESLWCFVMQHRGETGTCSKQAGSVVCLSTSVFKHQKYLFSSFPVTKMRHLCNTETLGDTEFYWDFKKNTNHPTKNPSSVFHPKKSWRHWGLATSSPDLFCTFCKAGINWSFWLCFLFPPNFFFPKLICLPWLQKL